VLFLHVWLLVAASVVCFVAVAAATFVVEFLLQGLMHNIQMKSSFLLKMMTKNQSQYNQHQVTNQLVKPLN
jgi:hypothetical protein